MMGWWGFGWYAPLRPGHTPLAALRLLAPLSQCERGGLVVWLGGRLTNRPYGVFGQHILQCFPFESPRPLGPFPLTLTLSHGGERGYCPSLPFWMDVASAEAPALAGMTVVVAWMTGVLRE